MVRLRLRRTGTRNKACFRIVATDIRNPRDGRFIEVIGHYDPRHQQEQVDLERADYWIRNGAQPTAIVKGIIARAKSGRKLAVPEVKNITEPPAPQLVPAGEAAAEAAPAEAAAESAPAETNA